MAAKILLVEDDNNLREIYEARLQAEGYIIVTAQDGEEALVVAKAEKPDLIISDVMMPRISGFEMLDILRNTDELKQIKVIMLTALGQAEDKTRANSLGADRYLVKSQVTLEDIVKAAHELIDGATTPTTVPAPTPVAVAPTDTPPTPTVTPMSPTTTSPPVATPAAPATEPVAGPAVLSTPEATIPPVAPVVTSAAPVVTEPATTPPVATPNEDVTKLNTPTAAEEDATVGAQIQDFANQTVTSPSSPSPTAAASDDNVLSKAVNDLTASTPQKVYLTPAPEMSVTPAPNVTETVSNDQVTIANKKIIQPLVSEPKPGLDELLAAEEAKDAQAANNSTVVMPPENTTPTAGPIAPGTGFNNQPPQPSGPSDSDPNNIAL
jgi:CheY-like chemotaxis protein